MQNVHRPKASISKEERIWATVSHLSALCFFAVPPIGHIIAPLIIWLIKREDSHYLDQHGKEAINFQISFTIYMFVALIMMFTQILFVVGLPVAIGLGIFWLVAMIIAAIKANDGKHTRYPLTIRFLKDEEGNSSNR